MQVSFAQIDCPDFTPDNSGNSFYPPEGSTIGGDYIQFPIGIVDQIYGENIQFFTPDHQLELDGTSFQFDSIQIDDIYFLPNGIDYQCSTDNCMFLENQSACIQLFGTPEENGIFTPRIRGTIFLSYDTGISGPNTVHFDIGYPYHYSNFYLETEEVNYNTVNDIFEWENYHMGQDFLLIIYESDVIEGCTDASACNYNLEATDDDGTCYNNDLGCC